MSSAKEIRHKIRDLLRDGDERAAGRWTTNLRGGLSDMELPGGIVYALDRRNEQTVESPARFFKRTQRYAVEFALELDPKSRDDGQDELDLWADDVEHLLLDDDTLDGVCMSIRPAEATYAFTDDGKRSLAAMRLVFEVDFEDEFPGEVALPDLERVDVQVGSDPAVGSVTIEN